MKKIIYMIIWCIATSLIACTGTDVFDSEEAHIDSDAISFKVSSNNISDLKTRSEFQDTTDLLKPLMLYSSELDFPLYLHSCIAEIGEMDAVETKSAQVNDIADFVALNKTDGFHLTAYELKDNTDFIPRFAVAKPQSENVNENIWNTVPKYYWPIDDRAMRFRAYAPMSAKDLLTDLNMEGETISFDYQVPAGEVKDNYHNAAESQPDIMFAFTECKRSTVVDGKVPLNFSHALSAIKFAVRDVVGGTIEKISILGVAGNAHCVFARNQGESEFSYNWSEYGTADCNYSQTFNYTTKNNNTGFEDDSKDVIINDELPAKTFLLIPQDIPSEAKIEVIFRRSSDNAIFTMSGLIRSNNVTRWEPGKEYIYTISTNSSNWIYHLDVLGSEQAINDDEPGKGAFKDKEGHIIVNQTVTKGAYYKVRSYRERADNLNIKEPVPWKISDISDGTTIFPQEEIGFPDQNPAISADEWIPVRVSSGDGSADYKKIDVEFCPQMTGTTHLGDWDLQSRAEYGTAESPVDLSMVYGKMNTANCYVVNGPGYFKFPLVYGNAITDGITNTGCYRYTDPGTYANKTTFPSLTSFVDYKGNAISSPGITGAADAVLVWEDAYNVISDVKLNPADGQYGTVSFKVNKKNLQQGNVVIAIRDASKVIIWSWHIWITEHWTNEGDLRLTGDVTLGAADAGYVQNNNFSVAPQNLGWCDSKNVWYLKRTGDITFTQDVSGKQVKLDVEQREKKIEYWIGNNTYYQFGRKDPIVGFMNKGSVVKYNFGYFPYVIEAQAKSIAEGIRNPHILFVGAEAIASNNDWLSTHYHNLWNNSATVPPPAGSKAPSEKILQYHYSGVKTVYDPCPAGYQVPPVAFFKKITNGLALDENALVNGVLNFNGTAEELTEKGYYIYKINTETPGVYLNLTGTGHRWYATGGIENMPAGGNFNPGTAYLWSNQIVFTNPNALCAYGLALGGKDDTSNFHFVGRRAMARPVRPVKIFK